MYLACEEVCVRITVDSVANIEELSCTHEEADTRMILHAKHTADNNYGAVVIDTPDTDEFIIALMHSCHANGTWDIKTGMRNKRRFINLESVKDKLMARYNNDKNVSDMCDALVSYHAFTGCDSVSAFCGRGKVKPLKVLFNNNDFVSTFQILGSHWQFPEDFIPKIETFVCKMYGKASSEVNEARYKMYCASNGSIDSETLPPCSDALKLHVQRANYVSKIWKLSLEAKPTVPSPAEHGRMFDEGDLSIKWLTVGAAPEVIL